MKTYHVVFYRDPKVAVLSCYNVEAKNMLEALRSHYAKFPDIEPLYVNCTSQNL
jgi:hypothetical protein